MNDLDKFKKDGLFLMVALDHRGSLKKMIGENWEEKIIEWKKNAIEILGPLSSAILIDPEWGLEAFSKVGLEKPYLLSAEKSGYKETEGGRETEIKYPAKKLKEMGAEGVKLLIYYNPQTPIATKQKKLIVKMAQDCEKNDISFLLEIITYDFGKENKHKGILVVDSVKDIFSLGVKIDIFKIEFPGKIDSEGAKDLASNFCKEITEILGKTPWILLSAGDDFEDFKEKVKLAIKNGAKGFLAGRSLWKDFVNYKEEEWKKFFKDKSLKRLKEIS